MEKAVGEKLVKVKRGRFKRMANVMGRRELSLAADMDPLTDYEAKFLAQWLLDWLDEPVCAGLYMDLVYGGAHINGAGQASEVELRWPGLALSVDLPHFDVLAAEHDDANMNWLSEHLFLPEPLGIEHASAISDLKRSAKEALRSVQERFARRVTSRRIKAYKTDWLRRAGADAAIIGFLTGQDPRNRAQMNYTCVDQAILLDWHQRYIDEGLGLLIFSARIQENTWFYGSGQRLPKDLLRLVFEEARKEVKNHQVRRLGSFEQVVRGHNSFMIYTLLVLFLASGHRPVSHPFEFRGDFDEELGLLWISDKTGRGSRGTRLLPLPSQARKQVQAWIAHLQRLQARLKLTHSDVAAKIGEALGTGKAGQRQAPFFFKLEMSGEIRPMRPALQEEAMREILPVELNWTRHVLRSALVGKCDPAALDAFLGHGHLGEDPFVSGSSLGLSDLMKVADQIDDLMKECSVISIEGPL